MTLRFFIPSVILLVLATVNDGICQTKHRRDSTWSYYIGAKVQLGNILINNSKMNNLKIDHPFIIQADFSVLKNEQRVWNYCSCFIKNGISFSYANLGNAKSLGYSIGMQFFTEPILLLHPKMSITLRGGAGLAYNNKIYDRETNPNNITVSKPISYLLTLNPNVYFLISERIQLSAGVQMNHISNGGTRWPNWGLNYATANLGASYMIHPQKLKPRSKSPLTDRSLKFLVHVFAGAHHADPTGQWSEKSRGVGGVNVGAVKPISRVNLLGIGGEVYYDGISKVLENESGKNYHAFIGSASVQHYFSLGKFLFGQQLSFVLTPRNPNMKSRIYERYILAYRIKENWVAGFSLRSHGKISDYLTLTTGFIF